MGDSIGAGWGVDVEAAIRVDPGTKLGRPCARQPSGSAVEIINCAVPGHSPGQRWCHFSQVGWPMKPDLVIYRIDRGRRRLGRTAAPLSAGARHRLGFAGLSSRARAARLDRLRQPR